MPRPPRESRTPRTPRTGREPRTAEPLVEPKVGEVWRYRDLQDATPEEHAANRFIISKVTRRGVTYYHPAAEAETRPLAVFLAEFEPNK